MHCDGVVPRARAEYARSQTKGEDVAGAKPSADDSAGASPQASKAAARKTAERSTADGDAAGAGGSPGPARDSEQTGRVTRREAARRSEAKAAAAVEVEAVRKGNLMRLGCVNLPGTACLHLLRLLVCAGYSWP